MKDVLRIECSRRNLQQVRDFVRGFLSRRAVPELLINQVVLAVDEVVANFIIHANGEDERQFIDLEIVVSGRLLSIEIADQGDTIFIPKTHVSPDLPEYIRQGRKGGMGMALVNRLMDRVEFFTRDHHTVCHLSKELV
ncbi:ATP-binding protein [Hymenobacter coccineus]|uniref:Histidine kinase/HSP90-like ATPase domain-containing protein n=1 Tax=Hymenobacter coccineus TaxID=1908235 RepID=A0A1G1T078_9BACT|nr:ATP-binding protein [Hymenobacter coccineus]OGX84269.1 hypothetical protein BEN49_11385 [Hymenobacter coccineus]